MSGMFWEFHQQRRIAEANGAASSAKARADRAGADIVHLERRLDRLSMLCQAMWELLRDNTGLADEDVYRRMEEIDSRDGKGDGRMGRHRLTCPKCGRNGNSSQAACVYCGQDFSQAKSHLFG